VSQPFTYIDSSVVLAHVLVEPVAPTPNFWTQPLISSRLLEYETWTAVYRDGRTDTHGDTLRSTLGSVAMVELIRPVVGKASWQAKGVLRTLDALHLATLRFLLEEDQQIRLATYDRRLRAVAEAGGIELYPL
jgi:hypothetical protein